MTRALRAHLREGYKFCLSMLCISRVNVAMACCLCPVLIVLGSITKVTHGGLDIPLYELFE